MPLVKECAHEQLLKPPGEKQSFVLTIPPWHPTTKNKPMKCSVPPRLFPSCKMPHIKGRTPHPNNSSESLYMAGLWAKLPSRRALRSYGLTKSPAWKASVLSVRAAFNQVWATLESRACNFGPLGFPGKPKSQAELTEAQARFHELLSWGLREPRAAQGSLGVHDIIIRNIHKSVCIYIYTHIYLYMYIYMYVYVHMYLGICVCIYEYVSAYAHMYVYVCCIMSCIYPYLYLYLYLSTLTFSVTYISLSLST